MLLRPMRFGRPIPEQGIWGGYHGFRTSAIRVEAACSSDHCGTIALHCLAFCPFSRDCSEKLERLFGFLNRSRDLEGLIRSWRVNYSHYSSSYFRATPVGPLHAATSFVGQTEPERNVFADEISPQLLKSYVTKGWGLTWRIVAPTNLFLGDQVVGTPVGGRRLQVGHH